MRRRDLIAALAGAAVVIVLAGGVAWAAIPDAGGVVHTCYSQSTGTWRPIDYPTAKCKGGETLLDLNQKGVKGDQGIQGVPGQNGANGTDGEDGISVASTPLNPGESLDCPQGGSQFTSVSGDTFACNGAPGSDGAEGPPGAPGPSGISGYEVVEGQSQILDPFEFIHAFASCPTGKRALGGGYEGAAPGGGVSESFPTSDGTSWKVNGQAGLFPGFVRVWAVCATVLS